MAKCGRCSRWHQQSSGALRGDRFTDLWQQLSSNAMRELPYTFYNMQPSGKCATPILERHIVASHTSSDKNAPGPKILAGFMQVLTLVVTGLTLTPQVRVVSVPSFALAWILTRNSHSAATQVVGLGEYTAGMFTNSTGLAQQLERASETTFGPGLQATHARGARGVLIRCLLTCCKRRRWKGVGQHCRL